MDTPTDPRAARVVRVLNSYRVLTHDSLAELCDVKMLGGSGAFEHALHDEVEETGDDALRRRWERRHQQPRMQPAATPPDRWNRRRTLGC